MTAAPAIPNPLRDGLRRGGLVVTVEVTTPKADIPLDTAIRSILALARAVRDDARIQAIALTDRSRSDHDHDPLDVGARVAAVSGKMPLVHWAGKDRTLARLEADLRRAEALGLDTLLLVTGDKVRHPPADRPVRYLDSVNALHAARGQWPRLLLAGAVSPFKYREEELLGQYLKAAKKLRAGADFLITQIGWDMRKLEEARTFLTARGYRAPMVAELLYLTPRRARHIQRIGLPGVIITDGLLRLLERDQRASEDGHAAALRRLAMQIVGVRHLGYAGVQISGLHTHAHVARVLDETDRLADAYPSREAWEAAWQAMHRLADESPAALAPVGGAYFEGGAAPASAGGALSSRGEVSRYRAMDFIDHVAFREGSSGARLLGPAIGRLPDRSRAAAILLRVERAVKEPLAGCQACGFCRLPQTAYVCPETCPKGLANGPCGGTRDNWCEFGDRECIHNRIYRLAKHEGRLADLEEVLIPPVPDDAWESCSWVRHFRGEGPHPQRLPPHGGG